MKCLQQVSDVETIEIPAHRCDQASRPPATEVCREEQCKAQWRISVWLEVCGDHVILSCDCHVTFCDLAVWDDLIGIASYENGWLASCQPPVVLWWCMDSLLWGGSQFLSETRSRTMQVEQCQFCIWPGPLWLKCCLSVYSAQLLDCCAAWFVVHHLYGVALVELYCVVAVALPPQCDGACGENMGVQSRIVLCYTREGQVTNDSECDRQSKPISIQPCTRNCSLVAVWKSSDWSQVCVHACVWCGVVYGVHVCMCEHIDVTLLLPSSFLCAPVLCRVWSSWQPNACGYVCYRA